MTAVGATVEIPAPATDPPRRAPYLHQIDLFRLVTFACVILIHVVGATNFAQDVGANAVETPLHFTREAFFALTGFVLVFQNRGKTLRAGAFWRRRLPLVVTPYLAWSVFFWAYSLITGVQSAASSAAAVKLLLTELIEGTAWYHLYFLLVTMQVYLLFPVLLKLLRATEGRHRWLLLGSGVLQVAVVAFMTYRPLGVSYDTVAHLFATLVPYQFYTLCGAVAAMHFEAVHAWVSKYRLVLVSAVFVVLPGIEYGYLRIVHNGTFPQLASDPFQPYLIPWFLIVTAAIYALATRWAARRRDHHRSAKVVAWAANRSFSVFLVHPLALALLGPVIPIVAEHVGAPWLSLVIYPATIALTVVIVEVLRRLPVSQALTGRPRLRFSAG